MEAAVVAMEEFIRNHDMLEPEGWNRSNHGAHYRRRPNLLREEEYVAP